MARIRCLAVLSLLSLAAPLTAGEVAPTSDELKAAISRAIPMLEKGSAGSAEQRECFTCHNQALPVMALAEAERAGFSIDRENLTRQVEHTVAHLKRGQENYLKGKGQGGRVVGLPVCPNDLGR